MADDFEAMLTTIGQKFDMSFDEGEQLQDQPPKNQHEKSVNPENHIEGVLVQMQHDCPHKQETTAQSKHLDIVEDDPQAQSEMPFLGLLEKEEGEHPDEEQFGDQQMDYRSLREKFAEALSKAQSRKSIISCQGQFMERQEQYQRKKQTGLRQLQEEKERRQGRQLRGKPLINSYSHTILPHHTPIQQRFPAVLAQRKRKVEAWQAQQRKAAEQAAEEEERQMQRWRQEARERVGDVRSIQEYFADQQRWNDRRYKDIEETAKRQDESVRVEACFKPKINARSDQMMKKKTQRVPVYQKQPQLKKTITDPHCTFKPNLSKTLKRIP